MKKIRAIFLIALFSLYLSGCSFAKTEQETSVAETAKEEFSATCEDLKHEIHCVKMDLQLLESRLQGEIKQSEEQKLSKNTLQKDVQDSLLKIEKRIGDLEKKELKITEDFLQLSDHIGQVTKNLNMTQGQMTTLSEKLEEILKLNQSLQAMIQTLKKDDSVKKGQTYTVQSGDSLEKIAKKFQVNLEELKKVNRIEGDKIFAGQDLIIPVLRW